MTTEGGGTPTDGPVRGHIGFFPWVRLEKPVTVGEFRLVPWDRDDGPAWLDEVLRPYENVPGHPVPQLTLVEVDGDRTARWDDEVAARAFVVREIVSFAALARRKFFTYRPEYVNDHTFRFLVQPFDRGSKWGPSRTARRRDGATLIGSGPGTYVVRAPDHACVGARVGLDETLLNALAAAWSRDDVWSWLSDVVTAFTLANTDAPEMREHVEVGLVLGAIQRALGLPGRAYEDELTTAFAASLDRAVPPSRVPSDSGRSSKTGSSKAGDSLRAIWFRDLYLTRNDFGHGRKVSTKPRRWSVREHLLLAAHIVPLLVLVKLDEVGLYALTKDDRDEIAAFDALLCLDDCFGGEERTPGHIEHAWPQAVRTAHDQRARARAIDALRGFRRDEGDA